VSWVAWRQHSREAALASGILVLIAAYLGFEWFPMSSASSQLGLGSCQVNTVGSTCGDALASFMQNFFGMSVSVRYVLAALPALLGVFVAAPLVAREVEQGTHMFIWTQSITRTRWFTIKVVLLGSFTVLAAGALAATVTWWHRPLDVMYSDGPWTFFDVIGPVPVAYAFFALALGLAAGTAIPRTVPAMATTLLLFVAIRLAVYLWRPWFLAPLTKQLPAPADFLKGALQISQGGSGVQTVAVYQPADRFWTFQAIETGIFLFMAVLLISFSAWWLRHRIH
jgi:hypothetical protein